MSEVKITDFPTEILEKIFLHFDDTTNAIATSVCKRFSEVLNETVRRKYNGSSRGKWYQIEIFDSLMENEINQIVHRPFVLKRVSAIKLIFHADLNNRNHWIHQVINRIGRNIKMIRLTNPKLNEKIDVNFYNILSKTPNISHLHVDYVYPANRKWCHQRYRHLMHLEMRLRRMFDENELKPFVKNNGQLKNVKLELTDFRLLNAFDQTKIESLECRFSYCTDNEIPVDIQPIRMSHLKLMDLKVPKNSLNECIKEIVAPCRNLKDLRLNHFEDVVVTDEAMEILCAFSSLESIELCIRMKLGNIVRLIDSLPSLVSIGLWQSTFTIDDGRVLLKAANRHPSLRYILLQGNRDAIFDQSLLNWLMENVSDRIQVENEVCYKLVVTKGKVQYDGVTIMNSIGTPLECGKIIQKWFERIKFQATLSDRYHDFFSNLPSLRALFDGTEQRTHLQMNDESDEALIQRRGTNVTTASTTISTNFEQSVNHMNWLEKYCRRLQELTIYIEDNHQQLPAWTFPELTAFRTNCHRKHQSVDLGLFRSFQCLQLHCLKILGFYQFSVTNIEVVHEIDLFDNLVVLQLFQFNESMNNLLEQFNANAQRSLRHLTLANRQIDYGRYKMNNKTIIAISKFPNLVEMKLILSGLNETNTKYLFENCRKLSVVYLECNFLSTDKYSSLASSSLFADIKSNCILLKRLQLVWHNQMMDSYKVNGIKSTFPNVLIKIMQIDGHLNTKAEQIIEETDNVLERLFDEIEV